MQPDEVVNLFETHRPLLQGLAYRMLGSVSEAEDVVQETYLKWDRADHDEIRSPRAWLVTACSRLAIDELRSARTRREHYVGPWLPEPWIADSDPPDQQAELDDTVSMALLVVLEQVSPPERAAFLLHDIFDFSFNDVSMILDKSAPTCRKLASRARERIRNPQSRYAPTADDHRRLIEAFFAAARSGDQDGLIAVLHRDVSFLSDGGGKAQAALKVLVGNDRVSKFLLGIFSGKSADRRNMSARPTRFNGTPGLLIYEGDAPVTAITLQLEDGLIRSFFAIRNPDKLHNFPANTRR